jgi:hypothetical protein
MPDKPRKARNNFERGWRAGTTVGGWLRKYDANHHYRMMVGRLSANKPFFSVVIEHCTSRHYIASVCAKRRLGDNGAFVAKICSESGLWLTPTVITAS